MRTPKHTNFNGLRALSKRLAAASASALMLFTLCASIPAHKNPDFDELDSRPMAFDSAAAGLDVHEYGAEDHRTWAQADPRWGGIRLGRSSCTVASSGCLVTSVAKLIVQSGFRTPDEFDVASLANWLNANGGFSASGGLYWAKPAQMIDGIEYEGMVYEAGYSSDSAYTEKLLGYVRQGYHIVLTVKSYGHYVAVDNAKSLADGRIYIMDSLNDPSENADVELSSRYPYVSRICLYSGTAKAVLPGDADGDGSVTIADALFVLRCVVRSDFDGVDISVCDMNGSGALDLSDAIAILRMGL